MINTIISIALLLCMAVSSTVTAEPARKNTYYSQWSNGVPDDSTYFPIAVWYQPTSRAALYKATGVNMYIGPSVNSMDKVNDLKAQDMYAICPYRVTIRDNDNETVVGWMHGDEPDNGTVDNGSGTPTCQDPADLQQDYANWKLFDDTRPVYLNLGMGVAYTSAGLRGDCTGKTEMYPEYIEACDIVSFDIYPVVAADVTIQGNLWYVPKGIDSLRMWSNYEKPAWCWIECTNISSDITPTPEQTRSEVWMAIIHEASGIGYFCHSFSPSFKESAWLNDTPMKEMITRTNQEITTMAPALNSPTIYDAVDVNTSWRNKESTMVKVQGGYTYVYTCFKQNRAGDVTYTLNGISGSVTGEVVGEDRNVTITDGVFTDSFDKYGCHIYKIPGQVVVGISNPAVAVQRLQRTVAIASPVRHMFRLNKHEDIRGTDLNVVLYTADGTEIHRAVSAGSSPVFECDVTGFAAGTYYAVIGDGAVQTVKSFIILN